MKLILDVKFNDKRSYKRPLTLPPQGTHSGYLTLDNWFLAMQIEGNEQ